MYDNTLKTLQAHVSRLDLGWVMITLLTIENYMISQKEVQDKRINFSGQSQVIDIIFFQIEISVWCILKMNMFLGQGQQEFIAFKGSLIHMGFALKFVKYKPILTETS